MSSVRSAKPSPSSCRLSAGERPRRRRERLGVDDLRADVALHADHVDPRPLARPAQDRGRRGDVDAELGLAQPRRDVGVRARVDVGVHAQRDARARAARRGRRGEPLDLAPRSRRSTPRSRARARARSRRRVLPTPAKTIRSGGKPARSAAQQLAARHDVGAGAEPGQQPQDRAVAVRLDGVADPVRDRGEGARVGRVRRLDRRAAVDVERRAVLRGGGLERHAVADELDPARANRAGEQRPQVGRPPPPPHILLAHARPLPSTRLDGRPS